LTSNAAKKQPMYDGEGTCFYTAEGGNEYMNINQAAKNICK